LWVIFALEIISVGGEPANLLGLLVLLVIPGDTEMAVEIVPVGGDAADLLSLLAISYT
jgi:hypothetical protein